MKTLTGKAITLSVSISGLSNATRLRGGMQIFVKISRSLLPSQYPGCRECQTMLIFKEACKSSWRHANFRQDFGDKTIPLHVSISRLSIGACLRGGMQIFVKTSSHKTLPLAVLISKLSNDGHLRGGMQIFVKTSLP